MAQTFRMTIQLRRDTTANWELHKDIVPAAGEPCFDVELGTLKIGDGIRTYGELNSIGGQGSVVVSADGKSIILEDGVFKLAGFDAADVGAQPRKNSEGNIEWVVPSTEITDNLQSDVANLQLDVKTLQEIITPSSGDSQPILTRIEMLEEQMNGEAEGSVDAKIDAKINEFANQISDDGTVNTLKELINYVANHGGELETVVSDLTTLKTLVGDESVGDQITTAINTSGHITMTEAENVFATKEETVGIVREISVNGTLLDVVDGRVDIAISTHSLDLKSSDEIIVNDDGTLSVGTIGFDKITQNENEVIVLDGGSSI